MPRFIHCFTPIAGVLSLFALSGCSSVMLFPTSNLPEPRPSVENVQQPSKAMQIAKAIATTKNCIGCADTLLWDDEAELAKDAGFDPIEIQRQIVKAQKERGNSSDSGAISMGSGFMVADSMDGVWNNSPSIGTGLGIGLALGILTAKSDIDISPATENFKFGFVFPKNEKIRVEGYKPEYLNPEEQHARLYAAKAFIEVAAKTAEDFGFTRVGPIKVNFFREENKPLDWNFVWQPLENEALGCPKVTDNAERDDVCRVEWAPYWSLISPIDEFWRFQSGIIPDALGGNGKKDGWMAFFGYDEVNNGPLFVDEASNVEDEDKLRHDFALGIQKHMTRGMYAYVPSYKINDKNTPQVVMDKDHIYNFAVIVPRKTGKAAPASKH